MENKKQWRDYVPTPDDMGDVLEKINMQLEDSTLSEDIRRDLAEKNT